MNCKGRIGLKIIITLIIIGGLIYLAGLFPEEIIFLVSITLILLIAFWMYDALVENDNKIL